MAQNTFSSVGPQFRLHLSLSVCVELLLLFVPRRDKLNPHPSTLLICSAHTIKQKRIQEVEERRIPFKTNKIVFLPGYSSVNKMAPIDVIQKLKPTAGEEKMTAAGVDAGIRNIDDDNNNKDNSESSETREAIEVTISAVEEKIRGSILSRFWKPAQPPSSNNSSPTSSSASSSTSAESKLSNDHQTEPTSSKENVVEKNPQMLTGMENIPTAAKEKNNRPNFLGLFWKPNGNNDIPEGQRDENGQKMEVQKSTIDKEEKNDILAKVPELFSSIFNQRKEDDMDTHSESDHQSHNMDNSMNSLDNSEKKRRSSGSSFAAMFWHPPTPTTDSNHTSTETSQKLDKSNNTTESMMMKKNEPQAQQIGKEPQSIVVKGKMDKEKVEDEPKKKMDNKDVASQKEMKNVSENRPNPLSNLFKPPEATVKDLTNNEVLKKDPKRNQFDDLKTDPSKNLPSDTQKYPPIDNTVKNTENRISETNHKNGNVKQHRSSFVSMFLMQQPQQQQEIIASEEDNKNSVKVASTLETIVPMQDNSQTHLSEPIITNINLKNLLPEAEPSTPSNTVNSGSSLLLGLRFLEEKKEDNSDSEVVVVKSNFVSDMNGKNVLDTPYEDIITEKNSMLLEEEEQEVKEDEDPYFDDNNINKNGKQTKEKMCCSFCW